jgi:hypothetical protein
MKCLIINIPEPHCPISQLHKLLPLYSIIPSFFEPCRRTTCDKLDRRETAQRQEYTTNTDTTEKAGSENATSETARNKTGLLKGENNLKRGI